MTDERDREPGQEPDDATGSFDADAWFRAQFGGEPEPAAPPPPAEAAPPAPVPPAPVPPAPVPPALVEPVGPPPAPPLAPPVAPPTATPAATPAAFAVPPLASAPPPTSVPVPLPPPSVVEPLVVEPLLAPPATVVEPEPTQPAEVVPPATVIGDAATELLREPEAGESLDELFGESSFQEYDDTLIPAPPRSERRARRGSGSDGGDGGDGNGDGGEPAARAPLGRTQKVLLWVAGGLAAVLALVAVFVVGTRIPLLLGPAPGAEPIASASPSPTASLDAGPVGPVPPGDYRWDELGGGECLEPFIDAWQDTFTVVDCATPHGGQLVLRAELPLAEGALTAGPYPGEPLLASQTLQLCSSAGVLDLGAAGEFRDIVVQAAFPVSPEEWDAGERDYFCFVSRSSGEPLTASLVGPGPAPTVLPTAPPAG